MVYFRKPWLALTQDPVRETNYDGKLLLLSLLKRSETRAMSAPTRMLTTITKRLSLLKRAQTRAMPASACALRPGHPSANHRRGKRRLVPRLLQPGRLPSKKNILVEMLTRSA